MSAHESAVMVVGLGDVGVRTARQLLDTPGIGKVYVGGRTRERADGVASALHDGASAWQLDVDRPSFPSDVVAIAAALPGDADVALARAAVGAGIAYATCADDAGAIGALLALDAAAQQAGARLVVGCGLAPGLSDVLARHAAGALDSVDEIHVARWGVAGDVCARTARRTQREPGLEWREGAYLHDRLQGTQLVWFPDPVGGRECELVATGVELLVAAAPGVERVTARLGAPAARLGSRFSPAAVGLRGRAGRDRGVNWGAVRAEVWGRQGPSRAAVVYGVIEHPSVATGTVLGVTTGWLAGALPEVAAGGPGASGLGAVVDAAAFLGELARRGVKAAVFEGAAVA